MVSLSKRHTTLAFLVFFSYGKAHGFDNSCLLKHDLFPPTDDAPNTFEKECAKWVIKTTDAVWNVERDYGEYQYNLEESTSISKIPTHDLNLKPETERELDDILIRYFYKEWTSHNSFGSVAQGLQALKRQVVATKRAIPDLRIYISDVFCVGNDIDGYKTVMPDVVVGTDSGTGTSYLQEKTNHKLSYAGFPVTYVQKVEPYGYQYIAEWLLHDELSMLQQLNDVDSDRLSEKTIAAFRFPSESSVTFPNQECQVNRPTWGWRVGEPVLEKSENNFHARVHDEDMKESNDGSNSNILLEEPNYNGKKEFHSSSYEEALMYLDQTKLKFKEKPWVYKKFIDILNESNTAETIKRVSNLFRGHNDIIAGFHYFLDIDFVYNEEGLICSPGFLWQTCREAKVLLKFASLSSHDGDNYDPLPLSKQTIGDMDAIISSHIAWNDWSTWSDSMAPFWTDDFVYDTNYCPHDHCPKTLEKVDGEYITIFNIGKGMWSWFQREHIPFNLSFGKYFASQMIFVGNDKYASTTTYMKMRFYEDFAGIPSFANAVGGADKNDVLVVRVYDFYVMTSVEDGNDKENIPKIAYNWMTLDLVLIMHQVLAKASKGRVIPKPHLREYFRPPSILEGTPAPISAFVDKAQTRKSAHAVLRILSSDFGVRRESFTSNQSLESEWRDFVKHEENKTVPQADDSGTSEGILSYRRDLWHDPDDLRFYGSEGLGTAENHDEYLTGIINRLLVMPYNCEMGKNFKFLVDVFVCEGNYCAVHGEFTGVHAGDFLGVPPTGRLLKIRAGMHFRVDCNSAKVAEAWGLFEFTQTMAGIGVDLWGRLKDQLDIKVGPTSKVNDMDDMGVDQEEKMSAKRLRQRVSVL